MFHHLLLFYLAVSAFALLWLLLVNFYRFVWDYKYLPRFNRKTSLVIWKALGIVFKSTLMSLLWPFLICVGCGGFTFYEVEGKTW